MKRKRPELRIQLNESKHADILAWAGQQASVSESVIALIRTHLTLSQDPTLAEIAAGMKRIEQQLKQGHHCSCAGAAAASPEEVEPELLDALEALG